MIRDYSKYNIPPLDAAWFVLQDETLDSVKLLKNNNLHIFDDIHNALYNLQRVYVLWYNVRFYYCQFGGNREGSIIRSLEDPAYFFPGYPYTIFKEQREYFEKGEFETTKDFEKRIKRIRDFDRKELKLLHKDLSLLLHSEIKDFVSKQYNRILKYISKNKVLSSDDYSLGNYNADKEEFGIIIENRSTRGTFETHPYYLREDRYNSHFDEGRIHIRPFEIDESYSTMKTVTKYKVKIPLEFAEGTVRRIRKGAFELRGPLHLHTIGSTIFGDYYDFEFDFDSDMGEQLYKEIINTDHYIVPPFVPSTKPLPQIFPTYPISPSFKIIDLLNGRTFKARAQL
jgi:hypothetical protein